MEEDLHFNGNNNNKNCNIKNSDEKSEDDIINELIIMTDDINEKDKIIFDIHNYENFINKDVFDTYKKNSSDDNIYLDKLFFFKTEYFCKYHIKDYKFIKFKTSYSKDFEGFLKVENDHNIIKILSIKGVGMSTYLYITFEKFRIEKNITFIYFDINLFENLNKSKEIIDYIYFIAMNLFIDYDAYNKFCEKLFFKFKDKIEIEKGKILTKIIKYYIKNKNDGKNNEKKYKQCIIIDNYYNKYKNLYRKLKEFQKNNNFEIVIVYKLEDKLSNKIILNSISEKPLKKRIIIFVNNLYDGIYSLPNKYKECFNYFFPSIINYIKFNNIKEGENIEKFMEEEKNNIKKEIYKFYNDESPLVGLYANQIYYLINKELNIEHEYIKTIAKNIPLNFFHLDLLGKNAIKIKYASKIVKKIWKKITKETIIDLLFKLNDLKFENFIKGGIFEKGIIKFISEQKTFFGQIDNKVKLNCILNHFKTNEKYIFKDGELQKKIRGLRDVEKLKKKYENFKFVKSFIIKHKNNGKDFDAGLVVKRTENGQIKLRLFLLQISINKTIKQIKNIMLYLDRKINFIKEKILEILKIQINDIHILFIFNYSTLSQLSSSFCKKYRIPYIFFSFKKYNFVSDEFEDIKFENLINKTSFDQNWDLWKLSLNYEEFEEDKNNDEEDDKFSENYDSDEEVFEEESSDNGNIILDKDFFI